MQTQLFYTKPLKRLSNVAARIAQENYAARYAPRISNDVIALRSTQFNALADTVQDNFNWLSNMIFLLIEDIARMHKHEKAHKKMLANTTHLTVGLFIVKEIAILVQTECSLHALQDGAGFFLDVCDSEEC